MTIANRNIRKAIEILRSPNTKEESISPRIGRAITTVIPSEVSAIEVFTPKGEHAERRWASPENTVQKHFSAFLNHRAEHPFFEEFTQTGLVKPVRISDYIGLRKLRSTGIYLEFLSPLGIERQMGVALPMDRIGAPVLIVGRSGSDYSEAERSTLRDLLPEIKHLVVAERLNARYELLLSALTRTDAAVVLVDNGKDIVVATDLAKHYLRRYFAGEMRSSSELPRTIYDLLCSSSAKGASSHVFRRRNLDSSLTLSVHPSSSGNGYVLSLTEDRAADIELAQKFGLSPRQAQILVFVMEGLTNKEIAQRLSRSPHTIRTQVERLLDSLSVSNRTAAAVLARGALMNSRIS